MPELTCEQRIGEYYKGRMETIAPLVKLAGDADGDITKLSAVERDSIGDELGEIYANTGDTNEDERLEQAQQRLDEMPLSVEVIRTVKILLGTGGPGDWFEATVDEDGIIGRIEYHFNDWFDHADINVSDDENARAFCERFVEAALVTA